MEIRPGGHANTFQRYFGGDPREKTAGIGWIDRVEHLILDTRQLDSKRGGSQHLDQTQPGFDKRNQPQAQQYSR